MQGISAKEHQMMVAAFYKYEQMAQVAQSSISDEEDTKAREGIAELQNLHSDFCRLLSELEVCVKNYQTRRRSVQSLMHRCIRKMNPEVKKRRRYL
ncbi:hypothetical protein [uncultured Flavobacterium sp.]|uniref:hypothetical protein n=1 Tax=uncultured Flavobacterium sp. TaxID=165435 RepID=UPI0025ECDF4E|nr:hypothetical protein [uncultured Flavobacterium sp.]